MSNVIHERVKDGVAAAVRALDLPEIGERVFAQWAQLESNVDYPCVLCAVDGETEQLMGGTMLRKRVRYPVRVMLLHTDIVQPEDSPKYSSWRHLMVQAFHQRLRPVTTVDFLVVRGELIAGVPEAQDTQAAPMPILELKSQKQYENVVSAVRVMVECVFTRT